MVIKRDGRKVEFDKNKIIKAMESAYKEIRKEEGLDSFLDFAKEVADDIERKGVDYSVEEIQDIVENKLMASRYKDIAKAYIIYRNKRTNARENTIDKTIDGIIERNDPYWVTENSNKNAMLETTVRDYLAGAVSTDKAKRHLLPSDIVEAHNKGIIHFHDMDYFIQHIYNCCLINLEDMLQNGTVISGTYIDKPHKFSTACNIATQIIAQVASSQYGGQTISLAHLSPFVEETRNTIRKKHPEYSEAMVEELTMDDIKAGVQTIQYQVVTLMTTNGQAPFITVYMNLDEIEEGKGREDLALVIEETLRQRILGVKNEKGVYVTPAFPKLIYALDEINIHEDSKYFYLTELAAKCTAKRMVPDYESNKIMRGLKNGDAYPVMGCRSALTPDRTKENYSKSLNYDKYKYHKYYGRFNQGVVTINLPYIALLSGKDENKFWELMDKYTELCHKALQYRHKRLVGTVSDVAPILWQYGAIARLEKGEQINELLYHGYSTISLGYAGVYEMTRYMTGESHMSSEKGRDFAMEVMKYLNDKCTKWKTEEDIDYSVYGTPIESVTYKFAQAIQRDFGNNIEEVTNYNYITNSYHCNVREPIDAFSKLSKEAQFQNMSPGGAISYIEVPNMQNNIPAVLDVIKFIYDNIMYAELNTKSDYCQVCGYDGEIKIEEEKETGKLYWKCPNCGNKDQNKMNVARRTCGYIGTQFWNQGRTQEIRDRVLHL